MSQQQLQDEERRRAEDEALERSLRISAGAEAGIRRDQAQRLYGGATNDTAPDGRPLYVGTEAYEQWVKTDKRRNEEKA